MKLNESIITNKFDMRMSNGIFHVIIQIYELMNDCKRKSCMIFTIFTFTFTVENNMIHELANSVWLCVKL